MLVVLLTTVLALLVAAAGLLVTDLRDSRRAWANDVAPKPASLPSASRPALSFDDRAAASRSLNALQAKPSIAVAALYTPRGESLYVLRARPRSAMRRSACPELSAGVHVKGERVEFLRPIVQNGEALGTIYLQARYDVTGRIKAYAGVLAVVLVLSLVVALLASGWLQRGITEPMEAMADVARGIVERRDYSLRASKVTRRRNRRRRRCLQQHAR